MIGSQSDFSTVLVANRGEIACRVIRTVRAMGLASVAVYSEADVDAPHVTLADRAVCIGPPPAGESYLQMENVLAAAQATGADAVHPGYGFLSENAAFATACLQAGVVFIGPSPSAIELMGNKAAAKRHMLAAGVACVPGYDGAEQTDEALTTAGRTIGFPLMVKAAAGGGGRGMRLVGGPDDLPAAIAMARSEAESAFGSGELILEKAIVRPRHVEIQVMADSAGHTVHLGERDCSIQRRHQKVIEEAPCPVLTAELRQAMGDAAVRAAEAIGYVGAGTVEFLLDAERNFYFLEMNTRLQVEHPVTELVTGLDLVELQIRIARGESLDLVQDEVRMQGHAIEARLYTEDPARDFMPTTGTIEHWQPAGGVDVRIDDGIRGGQVITPYYDAMAAKIIARGATRDSARRRLIAALEDTVLFGPRTNKSFLIRCLKDERFAAGDATTAFIADDMQCVTQGKVTEQEAIVACMILFHLDRERSLAAGAGVSRTLVNWSSSTRFASRYQIRSDATVFDFALLAQDDERYAVTVSGREYAAEIAGIDTGVARIVVDGRRMTARFCVTGPDGLWVSVAGDDHLFRRTARDNGDDDFEAVGGRITAGMHGVVLELIVQAGARVEKGQRLVVMEAMKMQQEILSPVAGTVEKIHVRAGQQIATGDPLLTVDEDSR